MRIECPICGSRERREFYYQGADGMIARPDPDAGGEVWHAYLHLRDNPAGETRDLWYHEGGCGAWIVVTRNTVTHEVLGTRLASDAREAAS
ncbi:sarcosine oxidase subunit delta [Sulfitobacter aestuariivivens]|uniref:Sarcosine oxidase subunit delta n=1 Tax=Sulfitobacter aestuariivivens TaxID=2766981 RepID=A0A927HDP6_9RHOB|nr:sarcosine oxidase subunit delta [Sulfitobacter aestuariivivens]